MKGWIGRDKQGGVHKDMLFLFSEKPEKTNRDVWDVNEEKYKHNNFRCLELPKELFPEIKWTDSHPTRVTITIDAVEEYDE